MLHVYTQAGRLELTDPVAHLGLLECEKPHLAQRNTQAAVVGGLGCGAQTLLQILSVSLRHPPWLREAGQQSRFLCVFLHWRSRRLPAHISAAAPEGSRLSFRYREPNSFLLKGVLGGGLFWLCACGWRTGRYLDKFKLEKRLMVL